MNRFNKAGLLGTALTIFAGAAHAQGTASPSTPIDWTAIVIFAAFVVLTLGITYWAPKYTPYRPGGLLCRGGGVSGFRNGLAIAGDYMSAASFLGISALVFSTGYYGLIYSIGFP